MSFEVFSFVEVFSVVDVLSVVWLILVNEVNLVTVRDVAYWVKICCLAISVAGSFSYLCNM